MAPMLVVLALLGAAGPASADPARQERPPTSTSIAAAELPAEIVPREWLVIAPTDERGRRPFRPDAVFARYLLDPSAPPPRADEELSGETGTPQRWEARTLSAEGTLDGPIGYAYTAIECAAEEAVYLAQLSGAAQLFVNGAGFAGDLYAYGFGGVPIALRRGRNDLYLCGARGAPRLRLYRPAHRITIGTWDLTRPDLVPGETSQDELGVLLLNASTSPARLHLHHSHLEPASANPGPDITEWNCGRRLPPLALFQASVALRVGSEPLTREHARAVLALEVHADPDEADVDRSNVELEIRGREELRRRTFVSGVDASVQSYAVLPSADADGPTGLVLALHGAGVDALGHAASYSKREHFALVAPTNRRPYGFDWQDWGRRDAYEVLALAVRGLLESGAARRADLRVYATGHSMGGHGVWHLAANDPDRFLAIAPSAGWASFDAYGGRPSGELAALWRAADGASLTDELLPNLAQVPAFILHGEADDNVPARQGHEMERRLREAGAEPRAHYQPGAGHWWDGDAAPGVDCVDWPGIFELFESRPAPAAWPAEIAFSSVDPGVDAEHYWAQVEQPQVYGRPCSFRAAWNAGDRELSVRTENVRRFEIRDLAPRRLAIDGAELELALPAAPMRFERGEQGWRRVPEDGAPAGSTPEKSPEHCGPFKRAFDEHFALVYGTAGDEREDRELYERARYDHESWWYRANGTPELLADTELVDPKQPEQPARHAGRNLILYGNADTNSAWSRLVPTTCPIQVRRGWIQVGRRRFEGPDLACVFVHPRADAPPGSALVGVFGDSGPRGTRLGYSLAPFVSGVGYPDYALFSSAVLARGDGGVLAAGWFDRRFELQAEGSFLRVEAGAPR